VILKIIRLIYLVMFFTTDNAIYKINVGTTNAIEIIDIIEHYKEESNSGAIVSILLTYSVEGNIKPQEEYYYAIGYLIVQHYEDLQNNNKGQGIYCSFNKNGSIFGIG